ncbi:MAG: TonB-dependent receptor plug domain-containing protein, partial [Cyanobacteria bacterium P01_D01_bin.123]
MNGWRYSISIAVLGASLVISQPVRAQTTAIEGIQLVPSGEGLEIILQTPAATALETSISKNESTSTIDIANAQLQLAEGDRFTQDFPTENIASVSATQLDGNIVRIAVRGVEEAPDVQVARNEVGVSISVLSETSTAESIAEEPASESTAEAPASSEASDGELSEEEFFLDEIVVEANRARFLVPDASTGTRTDTPIRDTPLSIEIVPREVIEDRGATRLQDALKNVSGVSVGNVTDGADTFRIRGFEAGTVARDGFRESVFFERSSPRDTANIEQVEVLKGPSAILFGSLDAGGTINLITKRPQFTPFFDASFVVGSFSTYRPAIDFNYPFTDSLRARVNVAYENSGSFRDFSSLERLVVAPAIDWDISDKTRFSLNGEYLLDDRPFDRGLVAIGNTIADIPFSRRLGNPFDELISEEFRFSYEFEHDLSDRWQLRNGISYTRNDRTRLNTEADTLNEETGILERRFFETDPDFFETFVARGEIAGEFKTGSNINHNLIMGIEWSQQTRSAEVKIGGAPEIDIFNPVYQDESILA